MSHSRLTSHSQEGALISTSQAGALISTSQAGPLILISHEGIFIPNGILPSNQVDQSCEIERRQQSL